MAMPTMASYCASNFALKEANEALYYKLKTWIIKVTLIRLGFINSLAFYKVFCSSKRKETQGSPPYDSQYESMLQFVEKLIQKSPCK